MFGDYNAGDVLWLGDWGLGWIIGLLVLGVAVISLSLYDLKSMPARRRFTLVGLRAGVYALAVLMLLEPALDLKNISRVKNQVVVLVDGSKSMGLRTEDDSETRYDRAVDALGEFSTIIEERKDEHEFSFFRVGGELEQSSLPGVKSAAPVLPASDISSALGQLEQRFAGQELGGVVVISDGIDSGSIGRATKRGEELDVASKALIEGLDAPVNTVSVAKAQGLKDVAIAKVLRDDFAFVHNKVSVEVELQVIGMDEMTFPVSLFRDGELLQTRQVTVRDDQTRYVLEFEFVPKTIGKEIYAVTTPEFKQEALYENNRSYFLLRVIRDKVRVLQVVGRPSWDERFLRRLLKRNPNVDLISFFILRTNQSVNNVPRDELSLIPFPTEKLFESELGSFDLVIFQNFDYRPYDMRKYLPEIAKFIKEGGGFAMIGGDQSLASGGYARTPLEEALPVELPPEGTSSSLIDERAFRPELTAAGRLHPITQLAFDARTNQEIWSSLPEQRGSNIVLQAKPWATVLATHPSLKFGGEPMPVIAIGRHEKGRVMAMTTDSSWRWGFERLGDGGTMREYQLFWNNATRWLLKDPELNLVKLELTDDTFSPGERVVMNVRVSNPDYTPAAGARGQLFLVRRSLESMSDASLVEREELAPIEFETNSAGVASVEFDAKRAGVYNVVARVEREDGELADETTVLVAPDVAEYRDIIPRDDLLEKIAAASGANFVALPGVSGRDLKLERSRAVKVNRRKVVQLWDTAWLFLLILVLLGAEWSLRRRWGRL